MTPGARPVRWVEPLGLVERISGAMATGQITFDLDHPPEKVFDYIADVRRESEWSKDMKSVVKVTNGPVGDGTVFESDYRLFGKMRLTLQDVRRPEHLVFVGVGARMYMHFVMDIAPIETGSRVTFKLEMQPKGLLKLMAPMLKIGLPKELAKRPDQFRAALSS